MTDADCASALPCIAVNDTYRRVTDPVAIFAADIAWWIRSPEARACATAKYCLSGAGGIGTEDIHMLQRTGQTGLETNPSGLRSGGHSGYAAINLAYHFGASTIVLVGYDMQVASDGAHHWFGEHPDQSHPRYAQWLPLYAGLALALAAAGVTLINASRETAIHGVQRRSLEEVLCHVA